MFQSYNKIKVFFSFILTFLFTELLYVNGKVLFLLLAFVFITISKIIYYRNEKQNDQAGQFQVGGSLREINLFHER